MERRIDDSKKAYEKALEEVQSNKIMVTLCIGFLAMGLLIFLYQNFNRSGHVWQTFQITYWLCGISAAISAGCLVWYILNRRRGVDERLRTFTSGNCLRGALLFTIGLGAITQYDIYAIRALFVLVPVYIALYFVGRVMPGEFLYICSVSVFEMGLLLLLRTFLFSQQVLYIYYAQRLVLLFALVNVVALGILLLTRKGEGTLKLGWWIWNMGPAPRYSLMTIAFALPVAELVLSMMLRSTEVCYYAVFVQGGYVAACGLYYLYRLMNARQE
ncbi:MAG: hypothetical protein ACOX7F_01275 [Eubacteriales bacterium]